MDDLMPQASQSAEQATLPGLPAPQQQRTWTPTSEHDQLTVVHAALLQSHVNALVQSVAQGAPSTVAKVHTDAILKIAGDLSTHVNTQANSDAVAATAASKAVAAKVVAAKAPAAAPTVVPVSSSSASSVVPYVIAAVVAVAAVVVAHLKHVF
jgi:hypothetical protein